MDAPVTNAIAAMAAVQPWKLGDPFDRLIGATAMTMDLSLVTKDEALTALLPDHALW